MLTIITTNKIHRGKSLGDLKAHVVGTNLFQVFAHGADISVIVSLCMVMMLTSVPGGMLSLELVSDFRCVTGALSCL